MGSIAFHQSGAIVHVFRRLPTPFPSGFVWSFWTASPFYGRICKKRPTNLVPQDLKKKRQQSEAVVKLAAAEEHSNTQSQALAWRTSSLSAQSGFAAFFINEGSSRHLMACACFPTSHGGATHSRGQAWTSKLSLGRCVCTGPTGRPHRISTGCFGGGPCKCVILG